MTEKLKELFLIAIPPLIMIGIIPFIKNDYLLSLIYVVMIVGLFLRKHDSNDILALFFGIFVITFFEFIFVTTGVETFNRNTLFGLMPLWLPILWGYGFVVIKRSLVILNK